MSALPVFNPFWDLPSNFFLIFYGTRRAGKNFMMDYMLWEMRDRLANYEVYLFSGTADVQKRTYKKFPRGATFSDIENLESKLFDILTVQRQQIEDIENRKGKPRKMIENEYCLNAGIAVSDKEEAPSGRFAKTSLRGRLKENKKASEYVPDTYSGGRGDDDDDDVELNENLFPHILIVMDDCVTEGAIRRSRTLNFLATAGRHVYVSVIILSQFVAGSGSVPPVVRAMADTIIVAAMPRSINERELLLKQYMVAGGTTKREAMSIMREVTSEPFRGIVINTTDPAAREPGDYLSTYGPVPEFHKFGKWRLGTPDQWLKSSEEESKEEGRKEKQEDGRMRKPRAFSKSSIPKHLPSTFFKKKMKKKNAPTVMSTCKSETFPSFFIQ